MALIQKTQFATEVTEASRRGTEHCIGANAFAGIALRVNPNPPESEPKVFLCELWFVLSRLCDEIDLRNLGLIGQEVGAGARPVHGLAVVISHP